MTLEKFIEKNGERKAAVALIDNAIRKLTGMFTSADLADTTTFMNGIDTVEEFLKDDDFNEAREQATATAEEMLEEEGFPCECL